MNRRLAAERTVVAGLIGIAAIHALLQMGADVFWRVIDADRTLR